MLEGIALGLIALFGLECLLLMFLVVWERPVLAALSMALAVGLSDVFFSTGVASAVWANPALVLGVVAGYAVAGIVWSAPKWWFYVRKIRDEYLLLLDLYKTEHKIPAEVSIINATYTNHGAIPDESMEIPHMPDWQRYYNDYSFYGVTEFPPLASQNKSRIITWMMCWPWSALWTLIDEPFKRFFNFVFENLKGVYQSISESAFSGVEGV